MKTRAVLGLVCLACLTGTARSQDSPAPPAPQSLANLIQPGSTLANVALLAEQAFRNLDADGNGLLDADDVDLHRAAGAANTAVSRALLIMSADLNLDGVVTREEATTRAKYNARLQPGNTAQVDRMVREAMQADSDKDGRVTWVEIAGTIAQNNRLLGSFPTFSSDATSLLAYVNSPQNRLSAEDFQKAAKELFRTVDTDANGTLSIDETRAFSDRRQAQLKAVPRTPQLKPAIDQQKSCNIPPASAQARTVLLSAYEADAVSTTTLGSQDVEVRSGTVFVEPGAEPLYLVVTSFRPTIWRFSGAVDRLERVVLGSSTRNAGGNEESPPLVGAIGVPAAKITFLPRPNCVEAFWIDPSIKSALPVAVVLKYSGKLPIVAARYQVSGFSIPSAKISAKASSNKPMLIIRKPAGTLVIEGGANVVVEAGAYDVDKEVARFYPGGVIDIDAKDVVSSEPALAYEVLPNQAGLRQLMRQGAIEQNDDGDFVIKSKIRFPAELNGAHSVRFLLRRGVPKPDGDRGNSCVIDEETGLPLGGSRCR